MPAIVHHRCPQCGQKHEIPLDPTSIHQVFFPNLVAATGNFSGLTWMGQPIWQNILDLWTIQETLFAVKPALLIECGTNRGGSAFFYAQLFDLMGHGRVVTVDVERMHQISHPRIRFLLGSSVAPDILAEMKREIAAAAGPVLVILDSDHSEAHVARELEAYAPFVTPGSFCLVQDGVIDVLPAFASARPGPLPAIQDFVKRHPEFVIDAARCNRFLISHHPMGWLRRAGELPQTPPGAESGARQKPESVKPPDHDYVSPGFAVARLETAFPNMIVGDKAACGWQYLRREIPHHWYVDRRTPYVGFLSRDEAHILYNTALQFRGKRALEIGCWLGWSAGHLALAGVELDVVDPILRQPMFIDSVRASLRAAGVSDRVNLCAEPSPAAVRDLARRHNRKWSLFFVDGNHDRPGPRDDAQACEEFAEPDAMMLFHDLSSPEVAEGLDYLRQRGWQTRIYHTMQIMGVAWRGRVVPVDHVPDPAVNWILPDHLRGYSDTAASRTPDVS